MGRRGRGSNVLFFDGHVKWMQKKPAFLPLTPPKPKKVIKPSVSHLKMAPAR
ncbi:MAG TPA: H-X9-DG-CTERM domain-containing protein [Abditibacterium sp.]|jgi:prepilin-type processing-associated H-X9-DG protein